MPTATANGSCLYYELTGQGPAVTLLHGVTLDGRMWADQVSAFAERYRVLVPDLRGFGRSQAIDTPHPQAADGAELPRVLGLPARMWSAIHGRRRGHRLAPGLPGAGDQPRASGLEYAGFRRPDNTAAQCEELAKSVGVDAAVDH